MVNHANYNYTRVLPRDLFNEAKLLKCIGKLILLIEDRFLSGVSYRHDGGPFRVCQNEADGSIFIGNISIFSLGKNGRELSFSTPLNSKNAWPLRLDDNDDTTIVFDDNGDLSEEFKLKFNNGSEAV